MSGQLPTYCKPFHLETYQPELFAGFDCACPIVNKYVAERLETDIRLNNVRCYVTCPKNDMKKLAGFFTLKNKSLSNKDFSESDKKNVIHNIPQISCIELAYFAISKELQQQSLGSALLAHAERIYAEYPLNGMMLHLISSPAANQWYAKRGYKPMKQREEHIGGVQPYFKPRAQILLDLAAVGAVEEGVISSMKEDITLPLNPLN